MSYGANWRIINREIIEQIQHHLVLFAEIRNHDQTRGQSAVERERGRTTGPEGKAEPNPSGPRAEALTSDHVPSTHATGLVLRRSRALTC